MDTENYNEFIEKYMKALQKISDLVEKMASSIVEALNNFKKTFEFLTNARPKYRNWAAPKIKQLYLDKRSRIYRCRNNC